MDIYSKIAVIMAAAAGLVWLARRFRQSAIIGYLFLGAVVGPGGLGFFDYETALSGMSEFSLIFLLFFIGLDFDLATLKRRSGLAVLGTTVQCGVTAVVVAAAAMCFGTGPVAAAVIGFALALSSTAIVVKAFEDRNESDSPASQSALTVLLGQDLLAMTAALFLPLVFGAQSAGFGGKMLKLAIGLPVLFFGASRLLPILFKRAALSRNAELFGLASLAACLAVAVLAHGLGAGMTFGAFLAGLVFTGSHFAHQIRADLVTVKNLTLAFFFLCIGMMIDARELLAQLPQLVLALVLLTAVKTVVAVGAFRIFRTPWSIAGAAGLALSQAGEFTLVVATAAKSAGVLGAEAHRFVIALSILTLLPAPALVGLGRRFGALLEKRFGKPDSISPLPVAASLASGDAAAADGRRDPDGALPQLVESLQERAIVVGYGPVGRTLCRLLERFGVKPCVIDLDPETVKKLHEIGREAIFGDASRRDVLEAAGVAAASSLLVTLPDFASRAPILACARTLNPNLTIFSRARYLAERRGLEAAGADHVAYEEAEVAAELVRELLTTRAVRPDRVEREVARLRSEIAVRSGFTRAVPTLDPTTSVQILKQHPD